MFSRQNLFFTCIALRWLNSCLFLENSGSFFNFNQPYKCSGILMCFSLQKGVFSSQINEWTRSWISLYCAPSAICVLRRLVRGRLVSIRWLENLDHMALARGKLNIGRHPFNQHFWKFRSKTQRFGSVQQEKFRKNGSPFVDHFSRSDRLEFWLNKSSPLKTWKDLKTTETPPPSWSSFSRFSSFSAKDKSFSANDKSFLLH